MGSYASLLEEIPRGIGVLLDKVRRDELNVRLSHGGLGKMTAAILFASRLLSGAIVVASLLVAGSILLLASNELGLPVRWLGFGALIVATLLALFLTARHFRYREDQ